ncbi:hypothetical protein BJX66DRAFT_344234 [Aspergillus keveii]|uniref:Uncharacterized protein n=1 Tax=Aspergillus keveii TaxID=714993 RepID=A0ABR4FMD1_9EURO
MGLNPRFYPCFVRRWLFAGSLTRCIIFDEEMRGNEICRVLPLGTYRYGACQFRSRLAVDAVFIYYVERNLDRDLSLQNTLKYGRSTLTCKTRSRRSPLLDHKVIKRHFPAGSSTSQTNSSPRAQLILSTTHLPFILKPTQSPSPGKAPLKLATMYKFISLLTLAATTLALPAELAPVEARSGSDIFNPNEAFCPDGLLFTSFQCCTTRVLGGVVSLDCEIPHDIPEWCVTAENVCDATAGGKPQCCTLPAVSNTVPSPPHLA